MEKQPHNPFSVGETQEPAAALPTEIPNAIGAAATGGAEVSVETGAEQAFEARIGTFLDPEAKLDTTDQLSLMSEFWGKLGHKVPELSTDQRGALAKVVAAHPERRVVPAPLLDLSGRKAIAEQAKAFPGAKLKPRREALRVPGPSWTYGKLLSDPESAVKYGRSSYVLRYKTPNGEVVGREAYVSALKSAGQAVEAEDGTTWVYPVMDVQARIKRKYTYGHTQHESVDPIATVESLIATQLLHQANGTPKHLWSKLEMDVSNEAVYKLDKKGGQSILMSVACVNWGVVDRQIHLDDWGADFSRVGLYWWSMTDQRDYFGVRSAQSGL
jgi:hypothetical protein